MQIKLIGDLSEPYANAAGVHILSYVRDEQEDGVKPDAITEKALENQARTAWCDEAVQGYISKWMNEYNIIKDSSGLVSP